MRNGVAFEQASGDPQGLQVLMDNAVVPPISLANTPNQTISALADPMAPRPDAEGDRRGLMERCRKNGTAQIQARERGREKMLKT